MWSAGLGRFSWSVMKVWVANWRPIEGEKLPVLSRELRAASSELRGDRDRDRDSPSLSPRHARLAARSSKLTTFAVECPNLTLRRTLTRLRHARPDPPRHSGLELRCVGRPLLSGRRARR